MKNAEIYLFLGFQQVGDWWTLQLEKQAVVASSKKRQ